MTENPGRPRFVERTSQPATRGEVQQSWATVLIVFGVIFTVWGLYALAATGSPLAVVGVVLLVGGLLLRYAGGAGRH